MALIFADDFQQWNTGISTGLKASGLYPQYFGQDVAGYLGEANSLGIYTPSYTQGYGGANSILFSLYYDTQKGALCVVQPRAPSEGTMAAFASGYRRRINYEGDTLYFGITFELGGVTSLFSGDFLVFGASTEPVAFTAQDQVGNYLHGVGIDADGFYTFNGISTTVQAYYKPATVLTYIDVTFTPTTMELWINNVLAATQVRQNIHLTEFGITAGKLVKATNQNFCIWTHSVIVADNTEGYGQRAGRKRVKTEPVVSTPLLESTYQGQQTALAAMSRYASSPTNEIDSQMLGSLVSPLPFVRNDFGGTRLAAKKPYGAAVNLQAKRLYPSADGLAVHPYATIAGQKLYGNKVRPTSTWKEYSTEIPIAPGQTFATFNFGYEHDYKDVNKVYMVGRQDTKVYGDLDAVSDIWSKATDLIAYDSALFAVGGFADYNSKFMAVSSDTATLPYKAGQVFRFGEGIHLGEAGGIYSPVGAVPQATYTTAWTLDLWVKETVDNVMSSLWFFTTTPANLNDRLLIATHDVSTTKMSLWNNTSTARVISTWNAPLSSTAWRHWAFVYDGAKTSVFVDGVLVGTLDYVISPFTSRVGIQSRTSQTTARAIIERYRFRAGAIWTANFNTETIYS